MPPAFLQIAIPVLYVYDEGTLPEEPPGFDMGILPVISRALKEHANTSKVTVITGSPTAAEDLPRSYTSLGLQYSTIKKASPEAGNLLVAEFIADHFDADAVLDHLKRIVAERQRELAETVEAHTRRRGEPGEDGEEIEELDDDAIEADSADEDDESLGDEADLEASDDESDDEDEDAKKDAAA